MGKTSILGRISFWIAFKLKRTSIIEGQTWNSKTGWENNNQDKK